MKMKNPQKAVHEVLEIFDLMYKIGFDYSEISQGHKRGVRAKKRFERKKRKLMKQVKKFIKSYRVNPVVGLDGELLRVEFEGYTKGFRAGAKMHCRPLDPGWVKGLTFPEPQKSLREVFG